MEMYTIVRSDPQIWLAKWCSKSAESSETLFLSLSLSLLEHSRNTVCASVILVPLRHYYSFYLYFYQFCIYILHFHFLMLKFKSFLVVFVFSKLHQVVITLVDGNSISLKTSDQKQYFLQEGQHLSLCLKYCV